MAIRILGLLGLATICVLVPLGSSAQAAGFPRPPVMLQASDLGSGAHCWPMEYFERQADPPSPRYGWSFECERKLGGGDPTRTVCHANLAGVVTACRRSPGPSYTATVYLSIDPMDTATQAADAAARDRGLSFTQPTDPTFTWIGSRGAYELNLRATVGLPTTADDPNIVGWKRYRADQAKITSRERTRSRTFGTAVVRRVLSRFPKANPNMQPAPACTPTPGHAGPAAC